MTLSEALKEQMKDENFKKEYEKLECEYATVNLSVSCHTRERIAHTNAKDKSKKRIKNYATL